MKTISIYLLFLLSFTLVFGQKEEKESEFKSYDASVFDSKENAFYLVSSLNKNQKDNQSNNIKSDILIRQIGDDNIALTHLQSRKVDLKVFQKGDENFLNFSKNAKNISQTIIQNGNKNNIKDFTHYTHYDINMEINQKGNNQNVQNFGTNSISKDMKVVQSGNGASVIILNQ